jgi:hypothetical protein
MFLNLMLWEVAKNNMLYFYMESVLQKSSSGSFFSLLHHEGWHDDARILNVYPSYPTSAQTLHSWEFDPRVQKASKASRAKLPPGQTVSCSCRRYGTWYQYSRPRLLTVHVFDDRRHIAHIFYFSSFYFLEDHS